MSRPALVTPPIQPFADWRNAANAALHARPRLDVISILEKWLADALAAAGISSPCDRAREIMLLMEGAMVLMLIHGDRGYAKAAAGAAKSLVQIG